MVNGFKKVKKKNLAKFVEDLAEQYPIYGPVESKGPIDTDDEFNFNEVTSLEEVTLKHPPSEIPPKKYFFPKKEDLLEIKGSEVKEPEIGGEFVILGVHSCDINSFLILDKMFGKEPGKDPYYLRRREKSIVIGTNCEPTDTCFCKSMGTDQVEEGFDLFLTEIPDEDAYIVEIGTEKGEEITSGTLFEEVDQEVAEQVVENSWDWEEEVSVETEGLPERTRDAFKDEKIWKDLGELCLGCGNCTMVCPCCNCFDVKDEASLESDVVTRKRTWQACTLLEFAEVAGGNFRETIDSRYRNWFYDKYRIFPREIEEFGCVGCGRCVTYCPVDIDPREVIQEVNDKHGE